MKKNNYWMIGGIAAIVIILIWILAVNYAGRKGSEDPAPTVGSSEESGVSSQADGAHGGMDHGMSQENAMEADPLTAYLEEQDSIMADMMEGMEAVEMTGNASLDFLYGMIPHHESAVDMAESYLRHGGEHEQLRQMAEAIIETQTDEISQMKNMMETIREEGAVDQEKEAAYMEEYNKMMDSHSSHMGHSSGKNVEEAFAQGMMMHHQMAVEMSEAILNYADEEEVKTLAQNIISAQEEEIELMKSVLGQGKQ